MWKELELGKRYTWEKVVEAYPGIWARMLDCNLTVGSGIIDGILIGVYTDKESTEVELKMRHEKLKDILDRTTLGFSIGVIECLNAEVGVKDGP